MFGDAILGRGIRYRFFVCDFLCFAIVLHLALYEFGCVVDAKAFDVFAGELFGSGFELDE